MSTPEAINAKLLEAGRLYAKWRRAQDELRRSANRNGEDDREQATYDQLIEFIEVNGLNYCEFDPREDLK